MRHHPATAGRPGSPPVARWLGVPALALLTVWLWAWCARQLDAPYLLPAPAAVASSLIANRAEILEAARVTSAEILIGFAIGFTLAAVLGYVISHSRMLERLLVPYVVAGQAVPIVAVLPLLIAVLGGTGTRFKVAAVVLVVFFPVLVTVVVGLRNIEPAYREVMRALSASPLQSLRLLEVPASLPVLLAAVRVGITLAVIGAVVGEFLAPDRGLGSLLLVTRGQFQDAKMFAILVTLIALSLALYGLAAGLERWLLRRH
jgi:NitT/TauT family transport system permease protein